ncbi:hypothetical protein [Seonamhaeicola sp.]|uniref:hypothetical protein n=1 Tax=Seonamhaeicola sp. TaxID=1912245 RepID=UPI00261CFC92|nr:hypothetical protein [Seonamhaeicola sp.]
MNHKLKNSFYASVLGITFLANVVNFHFFIHLFEGDEHAFVECDYCAHIVQQKDQLNFTLPPFYAELKNIIEHTTDRRYNPILERVKKTIITDYFFNKPPPAPLSI